MIDAITRYWRTLKYLKPVQLRYQIYYRLRKLFDENSTQVDLPPILVNQNLGCSDWIPANELYKDGTFRFLNLDKRFEESIDWNFLEFGKLWTYNLNYFEYLLQPDIDKETGLKFIQDFIENIGSNRTGLEPYPISLRTLNWIKFCLKYDINESFINESLYMQFRRLKDNVEYHLMGNHLLENGCALLIGGMYFQDQKFLKKGQKILRKQLKEQILNDGGHFERSPMYHQILLSRLLDCYNMAKKNQLLDDQFRTFLIAKAELMLGWLNKVSFSNGTIPYVNDATIDIAPATKELMNYAQKLGLSTPNINLYDSGYRMIKNARCEWFIDVGDIGPDYIPGHAHSDTFSFVLHVDENPLIVDTGLSTYEEGDRRQLERSTASHNTVMINGQEQTEVWKAFRVGRRAHITKLEEGKNDIAAEHDGYKYLGFTHRRTFKWTAEELYIKDIITGEKDAESTAFIHFHPSVIIEKQKGKIVGGDLIISFNGHDSLQIKTYQLATGFNQLKPASVLEVTFKNNLETTIKL